MYIDMCIYIYIYVQWPSGLGKHDMNAVVSSCYDPVELSLKAKHYISTGEVPKAQEIPTVAASNANVMGNLYAEVDIGHSE